MTHKKVVLFFLSIILGFIVALFDRVSTGSELGIFWKLVPNRDFNQSSQFFSDFDQFCSGIFSKFFPMLTKLANSVQFLTNSVPILTHSVPILTHSVPILTPSVLNLINFVPILTNFLMFRSDIVLEWRPCFLTRWQSFQAIISIFCPQKGLNTAKTTDPKIRP